LTSYDVAIQELAKAHRGGQENPLRVSLWRNGTPLELEFLVRRNEVGLQSKSRHHRPLENAASPTALTRDEG
jgi:hypothetical protein